MLGRQVANIERTARAVNQLTNNNNAPLDGSPVSNNFGRRGADGRSNLTSYPVLYTPLCDMDTEKYPSAFPLIGKQRVRASHFAAGGVQRST